MDGNLLIDRYGPNPCNPEQKEAHLLPALSKKCQSIVLIVFTKNLAAEKHKS